MATVDVGNVYEAVDRLRPRWLEDRNVRSLNTGAGTIVVYLNRAYLGDISTLRQFQPHQLTRIRYLDASQASATLSGLPAGVSVVGAIILETVASS